MIKARPARPPTTPPTKVGVDGVLPPPDPEAAVVDEDGSPPGVPVGVPTPPPGTPVSEKVLEALAEDDEGDEEDEENDRVDVVDKELVLVADVKLVVVWSRLLDVVRSVPENEVEYEVEFEVGVMMTGNVVTRVEPEIVCDEVTTKA
ncbi:MAG: hypothetical protein Q9171_000994 [Xanthocarpia ochracea]